MVVTTEQIHFRDLFNDCKISKSNLITNGDILKEHGIGFGALILGGETNPVASADPQATADRAFRPARPLPNFGHQST